MKYPLLFAIVLLLSVGSAHALVDATYTFNVNDVEVEVVTCLDATCSQVTAFTGSFPNGQTTTNGGLTIRYPSTLQGQGYAVYFVSDGYLPLEGLATLHTFGDNKLSNVGPFSLTFTQKDFCSATIDNFQVVNTIEENKPLIINVDASLSADTHSAFEFTNNGIEYVPPQFLDEHYSVDTEVSLEVTNASGTVVASEQVELSAANGNPLLAGASVPLTFSWTPTQAGEYTTTVKTQVTDNQCASVGESSSEKDVTVFASQPSNNQCYTILNNLMTDDSSPGVNQLVGVTFTKISNHVNDSANLQAVPTLVDYTVEDPNGVVIAQQNNQQLAGNPDNVNGQTFGFDFTPTMTGLHTITVTGVADSALCTAENPVDVISESLFVVDGNGQFDLTFQVNDADLGIPLSGVRLEVAGKNKNTNGAGQAVFKDLAAGDYVFTASKNGFVTRQDRLTLTNSDKTQLVLLSRNNNPPLIQSLPDLTIAPNSDNPGILDLTDYILDDEQLEEDLTYQIVGPNKIVVDAGDLQNGLLSLSVGDFEGLVETFVITVTDNANQSVSDDLRVTVTSGSALGSAVDFLRKHIFVSAIRIQNAYNLFAGDSIFARVTYENDGDVRFSQSKVVVTIPELGIRSSRGSAADFVSGDKESKRLILELPWDAEPGYYPVRFTIGHGAEKRVKYREIYVGSPNYSSAGAEMVFCPPEDKFCF